MHILRKLAIILSKHLLTRREENIRNIYIYIYIYIYEATCMRVLIVSDNSASVCTCTVCVGRYVYACTHTSIHTYIHTISNTYHLIWSTGVGASYAWNSLMCRESTISMAMSVWTCIIPSATDWVPNMAYSVFCSIVKWNKSYIHVCMHVHIHIYICLCSATESSDMAHFFLLYYC